MEVKEVVSTVVQSPGASESSGAAPKISLENLEDKIELSANAAQKGSNVFTETNSAISATNLALAATEEISSLAKSIEGIALQASDPELSDVRRSVLEKEANELVQAIKERTLIETADGAKPLTGDKISVEVLEKIGKALELILPDDGKENFGLGRISFSPKEAIIDAITNVRRAQARIEQLQEAVKQTAAKIQNVVAGLDQTIGNNAAGSESIKEVDSAVRLSSKTREDILQDPKTAVQSVGKLEKEGAVDLLIGK